MRLVPLANGGSANGGTPITTQRISGTPRNEACMRG